MQNKTALIVDDSRTASQMLRLMLEREEFQVDTLGSAEAALGYLQDHRPGIIFMDHLMPGMDGFQAVKEIKNSAASAIPIVMYTAKSGDLYVGQAHALGAVDILPKPPTRETLRAVFRRIDERADAANEATQETAPAVESTPMQAALAETAALADTTSITDTGAFDNGDNQPLRTPERGAAVTEFMREASIEEAVERESGGRVSWWLALAAAVAAFVGGMQFGTRGDGTGGYLDTLSWAIGESMTYPYGEAPFSGRRVEQIRGLLEHLQKEEFKGTVKLQGYVGSFCLVADASGWKVPEAQLPIGSCDMIGPSGQEARRMSGMQSTEFRDLLSNSTELAKSGIRVVVEARGDRDPKLAYPAQENVASAGDWNRIAAENNRIGVSLTPQE